MGRRNRFVYSVPNVPSSCSQLLSSAWDQELGPKERMSVESGGVRKKRRKQRNQMGREQGTRGGGERTAGQEGSLQAVSLISGPISLDSLGGTSLVAKTSRG